MVSVNEKFWENKKVFVTGHTGFKGSWLCLWLQKMNSIICGYSLEPNSNPNLFNLANVDQKMKSIIGDIRDLEKIKHKINDFDPDIVIHMAAQPLVRLSYVDPVETYTTNVIGTLNLLEACRSCKSLKSIVVITTDKCYENKEKDEGYKEFEPMGGHDPYSSSKGCCELLVSSYRRSYFNDKNSASLASVRAGNVIGGGDWSKDRLIPDILNSFKDSKTVKIRNPKSIRPWQHVLEPLSGYLILAERLYINGDKYAEAWNLGPDIEDCKTVEWILNNMVKKWGEGASWKYEKNDNLHEANFLKLDCTKAASMLNWFPKWKLDYTLSLIIDWYKQFINKSDMRDICLKEISKYMKN